MSTMIREWLVNQDFVVIDWPAQPPHLNPIENMWDLLKKRLYRCYDNKLYMHRLIIRREHFDILLIHKIINNHHLLISLSNWISENHKDHQTTPIYSDSQ